MRLDGLDAQEQLLSDRAVALACGRELADLALARRQRRGALERRLARAQPGRDELAAGALRQQHRACGIGVGQRGPQGIAGLDAPAHGGQGAAELEAQAHRFQAAEARPRATVSAAFAERDARGVIGFGDSAGMQRAGDRDRRAETLGQCQFGVGHARRPRRGARGGRAPARRSSATASATGSGDPARPEARRAAALRRSAVRSHLRRATGERAHGARRCPRPPARARRRGRARAAAREPRRTPHARRARTPAPPPPPPVNTLWSESTRSSARRARFSASATRPVRSARSGARTTPPRRAVAATRASPPPRAWRRWHGPPPGGRSSPARGHTARTQSANGPRRAAGRRSSAFSASAAQALASGVPSSTPTHARCARITRSSNGSVVRERSTAATRRARSAWRSPEISSASSEAASTASRTSGSVSPRELLLEHLRQAVVGGVDEVERRQASEHVDPAVAVTHFA